MNEPSFASLSPRLLARKGGAKPAMRPQHGGMITGASLGANTAHNLEDLGWNDMGQQDDAAQHGADVVHLPAPVKSTVHSQQEEIARRITAEAAGEAKAAPRPRRSAVERGKRAAFTLRLDAERHLKLRLACTIRNRSAQQIVTEALDALLGAIPELESLAEQVKRPKHADGK